MQYAERKYDITYTDNMEFFQELFSDPRLEAEKLSGSTAANTWLYHYETHQHELAEAERLNVLLPLIKWCVEHDKMTEELEDELYLYYEDYTEGRLDGILDPDEEELILKDLTWCYKTFFKK